MSCAVSHGMSPFPASCWYVPRSTERRRANVAGRRKFRENQREMCGKWAPLLNEPIITRRNTSGRPRDPIGRTNRVLAQLRRSKAESMRRLVLPGCLLLTLASFLAAREARGQGPALPSRTPERPGGERSSLGPPLGAGVGGPDVSPGSSEEILGGRPGPSVPRVPPAITRPGRAGAGVPVPEGITAPPILPLTEVRPYGPLAIPRGARTRAPPMG